MISESSSVQTWTERLRPNTARSSLYTFTRWMKWVKAHGGTLADYDPNALVAYQANSDNGSRFDVLDLVQRYVLSLNGRGGYKRNVYSTIRSFFLHNRVELPRDRSFRIRSDTPKVRGRLTVQQIRDLVLSCDPCHTAAFLSMFQGGMGAAEFLWWNCHGWTALREALRNDPQVVKIDLPGRKHQRNDGNYYSFLGPDAIAAIKTWLPHRPADATAIFTNTLGKPLSKGGLHHYWLRHLRRLGIAAPRVDGDHGHRTGVNLHELRDVWRSQWALSPAKPEVAEFMMGHTIDVYDYNKSWKNVEFYRGEYLKALEYLQVISSGVPFGLQPTTEVERLREELQSVKQELQTVRTTRRESDQVMDQLFQDPQFMAVLRRKLREMKA